jgi:hypothetical protein
MSIQLYGFHTNVFEPCKLAFQGHEGCVWYIQQIAISFYHISECKHANMTHTHTLLWCGY